MRPLFITFTGIDDRTDLTRADRLAEQYPIEWGVLFTHTNRDARFPCQQAIDEIATINGLRSAHLCGGASRNFQSTGALPEGMPVSKFQRVQVNGYEINTRLFWSVIERHRVQIICQTRSGFSAGGFYQLYDCSGGRGIMPDKLPPHPGRDMFVGYAGGMGPDTVKDYLSKIEGNGHFWIDMEGQVRTDGWFDLDKVERVCELVYAA